MTLFKPRVGKVIFAQTTGGLSVIIPKQYYTYFHILFHLHTFLQMFLNNNFQFLNTHTKRALNIFKVIVNKIFQKSLDIIFMRNKKICQNTIIFFHKIFSKLVH